MDDGGPHETGLGFVHALSTGEVTVFRRQELYLSSGEATVVGHVGTANGKMTK